MIQKFFYSLGEIIERKFNFFFIVSRSEIDNILENFELNLN
jgi:hypothetical protein